MKVRILLAGMIATGALLGSVTGCGSAGPSPTHVVRIDLGGYVAWSGDTTRGLAGVTITLTDIDGDTRTAVTNSQGLWVIEDVKPGAYIEMYEATGYEPVTDTFLLEAGGENDVKNIFVSRGTVTLVETRLRATVAPYGVTLMDGDDVRDGFGGIAATYVSGTDIVVTFSRRIYNPGGFEVYVIDDPSGDFALGVIDTSNETTYTIRAADIAAMDGGLGPATDTDPYTWDLILYIDNVQSWTPMHGTLESMDASIEMNATP